MSLWGNGSSLEAVEVKGLGSFRGRALSTCHSLDLRTLVHITLAIQPLPTSARLGFGFLAPWRIWGVWTLWDALTVRQPVLRPRQLSCQSYALALARPDMELCDDTGGVQGSTREPSNARLFQDFLQSPLSGGGQGFSCLALVENGGTAPTLRDLPGSVHTSHLPSAFHPRCWLILLLWVENPPLYITIRSSELGGLWYKLHVPSPPTLWLWGIQGIKHKNASSLKLSSQCSCL